MTDRKSDHKGVIVSPHVFTISISINRLLLVLIVETDFPACVLVLLTPDCCSSLGNEIQQHGLGFPTDLKGYVKNARDLFSCAWLIVTDALMCVSFCIFFAVDV